MPGQLATARKGRSAAGRNVRMFAEEQGLEAAILELLGEFRNFDRVVGGKEENTFMHA